MNRKSVASSGLTGKTFTKFFISILIFTVSLATAIVVAYYILSSFIWYSSDLIYILLRPIRNNPIPFILITWMIGFIIIFMFYWRKTLNYVDQIVDASRNLASDKSDYIRLPSELKQVEERMNAIKQESIRNARLAKEAEQRKNDLLVYLAHDLKTPLTSVIGYLTLLRDEQQISEVLREKYLSISLDKAERLEELINEFFEITRFNLTQLSPEMSHINLTRMLEQITFEFNPLFAEKNLTCQLDIEDNLEISCDVNKMERVFDNLIRNAINYSYENSPIIIRSKKDNEYLQLYFINNGPVIPKDKLGRIFEQFYRLDTSRGTKTGGAGLGLAIAKEIVELHGGTISAQSEEEKVEFIVRLPLTP
ncbi:vancomycin resistance histidine kinase VanS [Bacillus sinesaloumensis]|uniref:vancomycin resistance histidine kinase VanS n=1 Tax=Litchfieldia sinesaloumensis TaxID=1926280 RepID=UPI00190ED5BF|nr:vancomycin resistance histidine kinase VanS [Bacillus sinesaloumensis]